MCAVRRAVRSGVLNAGQVWHRSFPGPGRLTPVIRCTLLTKCANKHVLALGLMGGTKLLPFTTGMAKPGVRCALWLLWVSTEVRSDSGLASSHVL